MVGVDQPSWPAAVTPARLHLHFITSCTRSPACQHLWYTRSGTHIHTHTGLGSSTTPTEGTATVSASPPSSLSLYYILLVPPFCSALAHWPISHQRESLHSRLPACLPVSLPAASPLILRPLLLTADTLDTVTGLIEAA